MAGTAAEEESAQRLVARVVELWGRLDFAHNNADINVPTQPVTEQTQAGWEPVFAVNLFRTMYGMKRQIKRFKKQQSPGAIVNTSSLAGMSCNWGLSAYSASKWGVLGLPANGGNRKRSRQHPDQRDLSGRDSDRGAGEVGR